MQIGMPKKPSRNLSACSWDRGDNSLSLVDTERRRVEERRNHNFWAHINTNPTYRRRRATRRECDRYNKYVDWYRPGLFYLTVGILLLSCADATLTLYLLRHGAVELNPLMALLIDVNPRLFVSVKLGLTGIGLIFLLGHINFRIFRTLRVDHCLYLSLFIYLALTSYETLLVSRVSAFASYV